MKGTVSVLFQMKLPDWYWRRKYLETQITTEKEVTINIKAWSEIIPLMF